MYKCNKCQQLKPETEFYRNNKHYRSGYSYNCIPCTKQYYLESKEKTKIRVKADKQNDPIKYMLYNAKQRAKKRGLEYSIDINKLHIPTHCPIFGVELMYAGTGKTAKGYGAYENAASLDRIDPKKGYIDSNIIIVCWEANRSKALLTPDKFYMLARFYEKYELIKKV
jgi:hypothetical protein